jgi:hypothetical protein
VHLLEDYDAKQGILVIRGDGPAQDPDVSTIKKKTCLHRDITVTHDDERGTTIVVRRSYFAFHSFVRVLANRGRR